jgi:integrase
MRRPYGTGSIEKVGAVFYAREPKSRGRRRHGPFATRIEAERFLAALAEEIAIEARPAGTSLAAIGDRWMEARRASGHFRSTKRESQRWDLYVAKSELARLRVSEIDAVDVRAWLATLRRDDARPLSPKSQRHALNAVRGALQYAIDIGETLANPATVVTLPRAAARTVGEADRWTWLRPAELAAVLGASCLTTHERNVLTFAAYTGLRAGEIWALSWDAVDLERGLIRVERALSEDGIGPPKSGRSREVPILPRARAAIELEAMRPRQREFVFRPAKPSKFGWCHSTGYSAGLRDAVREVGLRRPVRFHDLRHTFASLALQGLLDGLPALRLEDLRQWLGHSDMATTQRYARLAPDGLRRFVPEIVPKIAPVSGFRGDPNGNRTRRDDGSLSEEVPGFGTSLGQSARAYLEAVEAGRPDAHRLGTELAIAVLAAEVTAARRAR